MVPRLTGLSLAAALLACPPAIPGAAQAQCMLANPSFEIVGTGGAAFGGWNQFGIVGSDASAPHGAAMARLTGVDDGAWSLSAVWQKLDTQPGDTWDASVCVRHSGAAPLTGGSRAILNIEWRDAAGALISYESHTAADALTPVDELVTLAVTSGPAPAGAVATHLLLGALQDPAASPPEVSFDLAMFDPAGPTPLSDSQWVDFPGGRTVDFAGRTWRVKGPGIYAPGPNTFCDTAECQWVDANGRLHVTVKNLSGVWVSSELVLEEALGYGDYIFTTRGRMDTFDPQIVLGLFLWQYGPCWSAAYEWWNPWNEIDVEFSRWGNPANDIGNFTVQPYWNAGNGVTFDPVFAVDEITSHAFRWLPDRVEFRSWRGGPDDETTSVQLHAWTYTGVHLPRPEQPRVHINLWQFGGPPSTDHEVVFDDFRFVPAPAGGVTSVPLAALPGEALGVSAPNPFRERTSMVLQLDAPAAEAEVAIYDVTGRRVRVLRSGPLAAGAHTVGWDGRDDAGARAVSGVYLVQFRAADRVESQRVVRLR